MIVLDGAAAVDYLAGLEHGEWVEAQLDGEADVHVPHVLDLEVVSAFRRLVALGMLSRRRAEEAIADLAELAARRYGHLILLDRIWQLRTHVTPYDAAYIALAEALGATLVTTDVRLARAHGHRARIVAP